MKKKNNTVLNTGTASLILIFAMLSLVVFAMLSLTSASAQRQLSWKLADHTTAYYEAETKAQELLAQVLTAMESAWEERGEDPSEAAEEGMQPGEESLEKGAADFCAAEEVAGKLGLTFEEDCFSWQIPVTENQELQVRLRVFPEMKGEKWWKLDQWKLEYTGEWANKQTRELYGVSEGEEETWR